VWLTGRVAGLVIGITVVLAGLGCAATPPSTAEVAPDGSTVINVVAAENVWGSLADQLGGAHVKVTSIIVPVGGNPHRWYAPADVRVTIARITSAYQAADPAYSAYFAARQDQVVGTALRGYLTAIDRMRDTFVGTPVGASESVVAPLADALGLDVITPARAIAPAGATFQDWQVRQLDALDRALDQASGECGRCP
jgi:hypothetical protein